MKRCWLSQKEARKGHTHNFSDPRNLFYLQMIANLVLFVIMKFITVFNGFYLVHSCLLIQNFILTQMSYPSSPLQEGLCGLWARNQPYHSREDDQRAQQRLHERPPRGQRVRSLYERAQPVCALFAAHGVAGRDQAVGALAQVRGLGEVEPVACGGSSVDRQTSYVRLWAMSSLHGPPSGCMVSLIEKNSAQVKYGFNSGLNLIEFLLT